MNQMTLTDMEYSKRKKKTKREEFLNAMDEIIPYYFNNKRGRKPIGIEIMLRMYLMQVWFNLSDEGIVDSIYDSYAMRTFMHIDFMSNRYLTLQRCSSFAICLKRTRLARRFLRM